MSLFFILCHQKKLRQKYINLELQREKNQINVKGFHDTMTETVAFLVSEFLSK